MSDTKNSMNSESKSRASKRHKSKVSRENRDASSPNGSQTCWIIPRFGFDNRVKRVKDSTQREIIDKFVDSMLESIIYSWIVGDFVENEDNVAKTTAKTETYSSLSTAHLPTSTKQTKSNQKKSQSELELKSQISESQDTSSFSLWSVKGTIHFVNDNIYEGDLHNNRMHGDGRFQWADGTTYRGQFKDNHITGSGIIEFKDNSWYEGEFVNNIRHGKGLYVDSDKQRSYGGHWRGGAKNGQGVMYYTKTFQNSYDGEWRDNLRHGSGLRRYCPKSGYDGDWKDNIREGNGFMIWPNADLYDGNWKNGLMCGSGKYIWSSFTNDSMSLPALCVYRGSWEGGLRNGTGVIDFGFGVGSCFRGQFRNNRKNSAGQLVTNNGMILKDTVFIDDNVSTLMDCENTNTSGNRISLDMCNELELGYHVRETFQSAIELRNIKIITEYIEANYNITKEKICDTINNDVVTDFDDLMEFEISSLRKSLLYYQTQLRRIYYVYATICNEKEIEFEPVLIRMYLWQMYHDCKIHFKGLTLYEIDELLSRNVNWQTKQPHDPFEAIYFWQFLHSLITVATYIYARNYARNRKPETVLASAFRQFIDDDILPRVGEKRGKLPNVYGRVIPLKNLYEIYLDLGNPCTVQSIICKIYEKLESKSMKDTNSKYTCTGEEFRGKNTYFYDDEVSYIFGNIHPYVLDVDSGLKSWDLWSFNNVPPKAIIEIFSKIFPQTIEAKKVIILDTKLTFFEFFEAFVTIAEESIKLEEFANFRLTTGLFEDC